ncbi:MAG: hypothetical protein AAF512_11070 [Pseudomonadota bacterium]
MFHFRFVQKLRSPCLLTPLLLFMAISAQAQNSIVLLADPQSATHQKIVEGFVTSGLRQTYNANQTEYLLADSFGNDATLQAASAGYTFNIVDSTAANTTALTQDANTLALICPDDNTCKPFASVDAASDLLLISVFSTLSDLRGKENMLHMTPDSEPQANALYSRIKETEDNSTFAVIYEPNAHGFDLYGNFMFTYNTDIFFDEEAPQLVMSLALHTYLDLQASQMGQDAQRILSVLNGESLDAVIYMGTQSGFLDLTDSSRNGDRTVATRWYASAANHPLDDANAFSGLEIVTFLGADNDEISAFYHASDAASFLLAGFKAFLVQTDTSRQKLLEVANTIEIFGRTGIKGFQQDEDGALFDVLLYGDDFATEGFEIDSASGEVPQ